MGEIKEVHQVSNGRTIDRFIGVSPVRDWIWQVIKTARRKRRKMPVALDKLEDQLKFGASPVHIL